LSASDRHLVVDVTRVSPDALRTAADWLAHGGVVAYPTDTYYGLAVDAGSIEAVAALFDLKGRDPSMAMPLIAASREQVEARIDRLTGGSARLADSFWPGPLSLILDAPDWVVPAVHGGLGTVAVRVPADSVARALSAAWGSPVTATSANRSGSPPASDTSMLAWLQDDPRVFVIDGGTTPGGQPSTLVDARGPDWRCVRAGAIAWDRVLTSR
jgi:L-threonylcarbamoyladenylate synthase